MKKINLLFLLLGFTISQAQTSKNNNIDIHYKTSDLIDFDLSSKEINVITKAPKGAKIIQDGNNIVVYGGKYFKITFIKEDFSNPFNEDEKYNSIAEKIADLKILASDSELSPGFKKFESDEQNGFLKRSESGLSFFYGVKSGDKAITITEGMSYDKSPDKFTKYSDEDIKVMYEAAKATVSK